VQKLFVLLGIVCSFAEEVQWRRKCAGNNVKKTRLKGNKPKVKNFTEAEAMQVAKLAMENQNLTHVQIDKLFRSFHSVTPNP